MTLGISLGRPHKRIANYVASIVTSLPNAMAKPIIDIYIGVNSIDLARQHYVEPIISLNYVYWDKNPNPNKLFFVKGMPPYGEKRTHHIHVVEYASDYWRDRIAFREYLKLHPREVERYNFLKLKCKPPIYNTI